MNKKIALLVITITLLLSACKSDLIKVELPHNNCGVTACQTTDAGHVYINGQEITK